MDRDRFSKLIADIYRAVDSLEAMFPGRHFTPDGHMLGSIGEAWAAHHYHITLLPASAICHDGSCKGKQVQIKATQRQRIAISSEPEYLLVLRMDRNGRFVEEYNGPGQPVWSLVSHRPLPRNGQYQISLSVLRRMMVSVPEAARITRQVV